MAYCTQTDVEFAVGGANVLVELLDKDGDGVADSAYVASILNRATAEANSAIQVSISLSALVSPYPDALIFATANIAAYYAYLEGSRGQGVPEHIKTMYDDALRWFDQVARRERTLGVAVKPATDQDVKQIDTDPTSSRVTRISLAGLW